MAFRLKTIHKKWLVTESEKLGYYGWLWDYSLQRWSSVSTVSSTSPASTPAVVESSGEKSEQ